MNTKALEKLKYPIGRHHFAGRLTAGELALCLEHIETLPQRVAVAISTLSNGQLDTPYRPEGWTVRQVVHHFADSHMNAFIRFKMALTENKPVIKPYEEAAWAAMPDSQQLPAQLSLGLLAALHQRWVFVLKHLSPADLQRSYFHPESKKEYTLEEAVSLYAWHGNHHLAHITGLKQKNNWK